MSWAIDASTPAGVTNTAVAALTTASFTPPSGSTLIAVSSVGNSAGSGASTGVISDSLSGSWVTDVSALNATEGGVYIFRRTTAGSGASMTVTMTPQLATNGKGNSLYCYVITGLAGSPLGASASTTTSTSANVSLTPQNNASSLILFGATYTVTSTTFTVTSPNVRDYFVADSTDGEGYGNGHYPNPTNSTGTFGFNNTGLSAQCNVAAAEYKIPGAYYPTTPSLIVRQAVPRSAVK